MERSLFWGGISHSTLQTMNMQTFFEGIHRNLAILALVKTPLPILLAGTSFPRFLRRVDSCLGRCFLCSASRSESSLRTCARFTSRLQSLRDPEACTFPCRQCRTQNILVNIIIINITVTSKCYYDSSNTY